VIGEGVEAMRLVVWICKVCGCGSVSKLTNHLPAGCRNFHELELGTECLSFHVIFTDLQ
jgi:hypothetical protein